MLRSSDREILEETYRVFSALYEKAPYPTLEGIQPNLWTIKTKTKAKNYKPENFVDSSIMKQLDQSGFVASVLSLTVVVSGISQNDSIPAKALRFS